MLAKLYIHAVAELMEDAAVQAGSLCAKDRSSQTPRPSTPRPSRGGTEGVWDLLRTQSLPSDSQEWLSALVSSEAAMAEFGTAAAEYALTVSSSSICIAKQYYTQAQQIFLHSEKPCFSMNFCLSCYEAP